MSLCHDLLHPQIFILKQQNKITIEPQQSRLQSRSHALSPSPPSMIREAKESLGTRLGGQLVNTNCVNFIIKSIGNNVIKRRKELKEFNVFATF